MFALWGVPPVAVIEAGMPERTVAVAVVGAIPLTAELAVITAEPPETPVTCTLPLLELCGIKTVGGTVATAVLLELRLMVNPPTGAGVERIRKRGLKAAPGMVTLDGVKARVSVTWTVCSAGGKEYDVTVMVTDPNLSPVTIGVKVGAVAFPGMKMVGVMAAVVGSLLTRLMNTPPRGAGEPRVTPN